MLERLQETALAKIHPPGVHESDGAVWTMFVRQSATTASKLQNPSRRHSNPQKTFAVALDILDVGKQHIVKGRTGNRLLALDRMTVEFSTFARFIEYARETYICIVQKEVCQLGQLAAAVEGHLHNPFPLQTRKKSLQNALNFTVETYRIVEVLVG